MESVQDVLDNHEAWIAYGKYWGNKPPQDHENFVISLMMDELEKSEKSK